MISEGFQALIVGKEALVEPGKDFGQNLWVFMSSYQIFLELVFFRKTVKEIFEFKRLKN